jgi:hypothetical protein
MKLPGIKPRIDVSPLSKAWLEEKKIFVFFAQRERRDVSIFFSILLSGTALLKKAP